MGGKIDDLTKPVLEMLDGYLTYQNEMRVQFYDYGAGEDSLFITQNYQNPERAICFVEFLKSPQGEELASWGVEGVHYQFDEKERFTVFEPDNPNAQTLVSKFDIGREWWNLQGSMWSQGVKLNTIDQEKDDPYNYAFKERVLAYRLDQKNRTYENKNAAMSFARISAYDPEYEYLQKIEARWAELEIEIVRADSEAQVEWLWKDFQQFLERNGIRAIEQRMTQRFTDHLKRYQDAGYYTDMG